MICWRKYIPVMICCCTQVMQELKTELAALPEKSIHVIVDVWLSRQKKSILGIMFQYYFNGTVKQVVGGFKEFQVSHTSDAIRETLNNYLYDELELRSSQVGNQSSQARLGMYNTFNCLAGIYYYGR